MNKQLLIIGCYLDTDIKKEIMRRNLNTLKEQFDVLIASHYPIGEELQHLAKYSVYDSNNNMGEQGGYIIWYSSNSVYYQRHIAVSRNPSYAVYQLIRSPLLFAKSQGYSSFIYMEGDLIVHKTEIDKLLNLKTNATTENKRACFFDGASK